MLEAQFNKTVCKVLGWEYCSRSDGNRLVSDRFRRRGHFHERLDTGYDEAAESFRYLLEHIAPGNERGRIVQLFGVVGFVSRGRQPHGALVFLDQLGNVPEGPGRHFFIRRYVDAEGLRRPCGFVELSK